MIVAWSLMSLWIVGLICSSDCTCSPTSFYKSCWIRRYPGLYVDVEESQRKGAQILKVYREESAIKCSRSCCTTQNFSCSLAVFHYNTTQDSVNCFHLQCLNPDSCSLHHRRNVILYNVTKGVDPDLLVFGKHFTTNVRVLPHMSSSRLNVSEPLTSDKRHFNHPPNPPVRSISSPSTSTTKPTIQAVSTSDESQNHFICCTTKPASTADENTPERVVLTTSQPQPMTQLLHTTKPTHQLDTTSDTFTSTPSCSYLFSTTTAQPSSTYKPIVITEAAQTIFVSGTLNTQQVLDLQTTTQSITVTNTTPSQSTTQPITELSTTNHRPQTLFKTTATKLEETAQTVTHNVPSPSKSLTTMKPLTAVTQTNAPKQTITQITTVLSQDGLQPEDKTTSILTRHETLNHTNNRTSDSTTTTSTPGSSLTASTSSTVDSQPYPNDTKGYISRNITTDDAPHPDADGSLTTVWHLAANTVLVVLATCATITFGCCCSVFVALSWRGRRRRKGRYHTDLRAKGGSMKLIKYVIVRESS
ncbi:uncharacterized protein [Misgurnus anguillicaudatus]|uniref:uncharacterized protein n=1 Tax=Misgurnus anguillicaudatus TaxID=75329 RepID=UPI003CCFDAA9